MTDNIGGSGRQGSAGVQPESRSPVQTGSYFEDWAVTRGLPGFYLLARPTCLYRLFDKLVKPKGYYHASYYKAIYQWRGNPL